MKFRRQTSGLAHRLHAYLADDLDQAQRAAVEARLRRDPRARAMLEEIALAHDALLLLRERPAPPVHAADVLPKIQAAIAAQQFETRPKLHMDGRGRRFYQRVALAATLLLGMTVALWTWTRGEDTTDGGGVSRSDGPQPVETILDPRPSASTRGLVPAELADYAAREGAMDGLAWINLLKRYGLKPEDVRFTPHHGVLPVSDGATERR